MYTDLNKQIEEVKAKLWKKRKYEEHLERQTQFLQEERAKVKKLEIQLKKEKADVARLERVSLTNIFFTIIGKKLEKVDKEVQEALAAELKYEEAVTTFEEAKAEFDDLSTKLDLVRYADIEYKQLLIEKEKLILDQGSIWSEELYRIAEDHADAQEAIKEYDEAIDAGNSALKSLLNALSSLDSAKGWSTWDMFGGGMITTAMKHSNLDTAKREIHTAQRKLRQFQEEVADVINHDKIELEIGGMLTFADYFFDGIIVDWMVHGKINDSLSQVEDTKSKVERLIRELEEGRKHRIEQVEKLTATRNELLENAK